MVRSTHVTLKPYGFDRASIKNFLTLITFPGKLRNEGGHCGKVKKYDVKWVFLGWRLEDEDSGKMKVLEQWQKFRKFERVKVQMRGFRYL